MRWSTGKGKTARRPFSGACLTVTRRGQWRARLGEKGLTPLGRMSGYEEGGRHFRIGRGRIPASPGKKVLILRAA